MMFLYFALKTLALAKAGDVRGAMFERMATIIGLVALGMFICAIPLMIYANSELAYFQEAMLRIEPCSVDTLVAAELARFESLAESAWVLLAAALVL